MKRTVTLRVNGVAHEQEIRDHWTLLDVSRAILGLAIPASVTFVLMAAETGLINALLASTRRATEAIAAYSI
ncbi:MAG: hypothetical protein ACE5IM_12680, partial [Nitrospinota bacterium]